MTAHQRKPPFLRTSHYIPRPKSHKYRSHEFYTILTEVTMQLLIKHNMVEVGLVNVMFC